MTNKKQKLQQCLPPPLVSALAVSFLIAQVFAQQHVNRGLCTERRPASSQTTGGSPTGVARIQQCSKGRPYEAVSRTLSSHRVYEVVFGRASLPVTAAGSVYAVQAARQLCLPSLKQCRELQVIHARQPHLGQLLAARPWDWGGGIRVSAV